MEWPSARASYPPSGDSETEKMISLALMLDPVTQIIRGFFGAP